MLEQLSSSMATSRRAFSSFMEANRQANKSLGMYISDLTLLARSDRRSLSPDLSALARLRFYRSANHRLAN